MAVVRADFGGNPVSAIANPMRRVGRWTVTLHLWWVDYRMREGLRLTEDHVVLEAGCRRTESGRVVPLHRH